MKFTFSTFSLCCLLLFGCSESRTETVKTEPKPFDVTVDMSAEEIKKLYAGCEFETVDMSNYGMCGGGEVGTEVSRNDTTLFVFWKQWSKDELAGFVLFDENQTYHGLHAEMTIKDFLELFPNETPMIGLVDQKESFMLDNGNCWIDIDSNSDDYSAEYTFDEYGEAEFVRFIDTDKKIASIFVKNPN